MTVTIGTRVVGGGRPAYVIAEIGLNHNGDVELAKRLIDVAADAGADAVKFQKRTPEIATPEHMRDVPRETPWGTMTYLDYRRRVEFGHDEYVEIGDYALLRGLEWFASPWDVPSVAFLEDLGVAAHKVASACADRHRAARRRCATPASRSSSRPACRRSSRSTRRSTCSAPTGSCSCTRRRPIRWSPTRRTCAMIPALRDRYPGVPVGYSGHERGLQISLAAVALGAVAVERHITLDRTMWGSDHAASLEPAGLQHLVRDIRVIEAALGDGVKRVFPGELAPMAKLRRVPA